jgi:hypothetical protein
MGRPFSFIFITTTIRAKLATGMSIFPEQQLPESKIVCGGKIIARIAEYRALELIRFHPAGRLQLHFLTPPGQPRFAYHSVGG